MTDNFLAVKVCMCSELSQWLHYTGEGDRWGFYAKDFVPAEGGTDITYAWNQFEGKDLQKLTVSHFLLEIGTSKGKPGKLYRKLASYKEGQESLRVMLDKSYTDMLTPDIDELEGFQFETQGKGKPVRVASRSGYCAVIMPLVNAERG
jgi:hypothetical protein